MKKVQKTEYATIGRTVEKFESEDGEIFQDEAKCINHDELYKKYLKIRQCEEWYYIESETEFNDLFKYMIALHSVSHDGNSNFPKFFEDYVGWIKFEFHYENDYPNEFYITSANSYLEELQMLGLI
jgi:hypothetical protein